jgi:hypothetical protein
VKKAAIIRTPKRRNEGKRCEDFSARQVIRIMGTLLEKGVTKRTQEYKLAGCGVLSRQFARRDGGIYGAI